MIRIGAGNKRRKHGPEGARGRLRLRPTLLALEGRTLLSTFTVNSTADDGSTGTLRWAIDQANQNGQASTITFSSLFNSPQTITLSGGTLALTDTPGTTITGPGANLLTLNGNDAENGGPVFEVSDGAVAELSGLTITGGDGVGDDVGGGVFNDDSQLTMTNVVVRGNNAGGSIGSSVGGGLATLYGGTTTLSDCTISGNGVLEGDNSTAGGIYNGQTDTLIMTDCTISLNYVLVGVGGGLTNAGKATLTDVTISRNSAISGGGLANSGTLAMTGCTVSGNSAFEGGGLMVYQGGDSTLTNCTVSGNSAFGTGAAGPGPMYGGGGAVNLGGTLALTNCTVSGNSAGASGGGGLENVIATGPVFANSPTSSAPHLGGGLKDEQSVVSLTNCTISGNTAYGGVGGVANYAALAMSNTIVAGNNGGDFSGSYAGSNNLIGVSPLLSPLGDYGGPTATMALLPGSPAIGGGTTTGAPAFDQRGQPRSGHTDIGAFQSQGFTISPVAGNNPQSTPINQPFPKPLTFTVTANNPVEPINGGIVTFAVAPIGGASATLSAASVTIAGGVASVTATANATMGQYAVSATATGADPDGFVLTNTERPSLVVTTNLDEMDDTNGLTSLREAIAYAETLPGPSTITFDPAFFGTRRRTIRLTGGPLVLTDPATITIAGPGARRLTIGGGGKTGVFDVEGGSLTLSGVTIANGNADLGGGLRNEGGRLVLTNVMIQGNRAIAGGGLFNDGRTTLRAVSIKGNRAHVGPGLFNTRGATLLWRRSPAASRGKARVDHTHTQETA
jgi:hypothetical protein